jgi:hypothetical protein
MNEDAGEMPKKPETANGGTAIKAEIDYFDFEKVERTSHLA